MSNDSNTPVFAPDSVMSTAATVPAPAPKTLSASLYKAQLLTQPKAPRSVALKAVFVELLVALLAKMTVVALAPPELSSRSNVHMSAVVGSMFSAG